MTTEYARRRHASGSERLAPVLVTHAMHRGVISCAADASLATVAAVMAAHRIHAVVVRGEDDGQWRIVSDLDLVAAVDAGDFATRTAGEVAASPTVTLTPLETLERAAQLMREYATAHLVVVDPGSGKPVGVISTLDLADVVAALAPRSHDGGR